ncbi:hypothetical protein [Listeria newyorkensis]|uniref:hypothetical protein n=1 Tax=Listeria newyorkensis TaxID=1497681 RepID=UPI0010F6C5F8|nr:hypothetical protein [Listeria newyorkensis]
MKHAAAFTGLETVLEPAFYMGHPLPGNEKNKGLILDSFQDQVQQQRNRKGGSYGQEKSKSGPTTRTVR